MKKPSSFSVSEWLDYLENRHISEIQLGLQRVQKVAEALNLLRFDATIITVAGTNGKGSTIASLEAIYRAAGYRVSAYTSPHLLMFNERIRVNQTPITDEALTQAFLNIHEVAGSEALTYFEMATLAALWHFKQVNPEVILLEVGMGGRLDATNYIDADLAIITTIDFDHEAWLGSTLEQIATEKAGIFRENQLAIYADTNPPHTLLDRAKALHVNLSRLDEDYKISIHQKTLFFSIQEIFLELPCPRIHPKAFAAAIVASLKLQARLPVSESDYTRAANTAFIAGRMQWLNTDVPTLVDVSHNSQSVKLLATSLKENPPKGEIHVIFSGLQDKTLYALIEPMRAYGNKWYLTGLNSARAASLDALKEAFTRVMDQQPSAVFDEPLKAYTAAVNAVKPGDVIVVYGSFLLVSAVMLAHPHKGEKNEYSN